MNKITKTIGIVSLMLGFGACANAQEAQTAQTEEVKKESFMKKAFYEEQKRLSKPSARTAAEKERMQKELDAANKRVEAAQAKVEAAKK